MAHSVLFSPTPCTFLDVLMSSALPIALLPPCQWTLKFSFLYTWIRLLSTPLTFASPSVSCCTLPTHDRPSHLRWISAHVSTTHHAKLTWRPLITFFATSNEPSTSVFSIGRERVDPTAFADSDYQGDLDERRPTLAYTFNIGSSLTRWHSKLQSEISMSTCEAEYRALVDAASEAAWLQGLLEEIGMPLTTGEKVST